MLVSQCGSDINLPQGEIGWRGRKQASIVLLSRYGYTSIISRVFRLDRSPVVESSSKHWERLTKTSVRNWSSESLSPNPERG